MRKPQPPPPRPPTGRGSRLSRGTPPASTARAMLPWPDSFAHVDVVPHQQPRFFHDLGHLLFLLIGHDMHARDTLNLPDLLDDVDAQTLAFAFAAPLQPVDDVVRNPHARHVGAHPF